MLKGAVVRTIEQENVPQKTSEQDGPVQGFREEKRNVLCSKVLRGEARCALLKGFREEKRNVACSRVSRGGAQCALLKGFARKSEIGIRD